MSERDQYRSLYWTRRWRNFSKWFLQQNPLCERCLELGMLNASTVVHHLVAHRGDPELFWGGPFQALCKTHHDVQGHREDLGQKVVTFSVDDGWPIDPNGEGEGRSLQP